MKYCLYCGKELTVEQRHNIYCSQRCSINARTDEKIKEWKEGKFNGLKGDNQISDIIRNYLLRKTDNKCELCGWGEINPVSGKVPLEIHHIDGNFLNNSESNLQVLCPNCHSLTPNYKSLNKNSQRERTQTRKNYCIDCGKEIQPKSTRCKSCEGKQRVKEKPVTREELKELIRTIPFTQIGKMFNITDNAVRKWCIKYNLPSKKKEIKALSNEEWEKI